MTDYIMLPRGMLTEDLWRNNGVLLRVYMYLAANSTDGKITTSAAQISRATKLTERQVRYALSELKLSGKLSGAMSNKGSDITLCGIDTCATTVSGKRSNRMSRKTSHTKEVLKPTLDYVSPPFVSPDFADTWRKFIQYRKEINKPYKSESSERIAYNKMVEMADNDPAKAKDMVERTILGQWQGLFPNKDGTITTSTRDTAATRKAQRDRGLSLAREIVSRSENLLNLYNGGCENPDTRDD